MEIEGAWWLMEEDAGFDEGSTPIVELWDGKAVWIRSGKVGKYAIDRGYLTINSTMPGDEEFDCFEERIICRVGDDGAQLSGCSYFSCGPMPANAANDEDLSEDVLCSTITLVRDSHQARARLRSLAGAHLVAAE